MIMNEKFDIYMNLLLEWNKKINLTAITEPAEIITKHFFDSLACEEYISHGASVVDVGTGAGFPGIPLKIERSDISLTLMDSLNKRINFLKEVCSKTNTEAECVHIRAEDAGKDKAFREKFDVAVSQAVANLTVLSEYCLPLVKKGGVMLAMKGKDIQQELDEALPIIERLGGTVKGVKPYTIKGTDITHSIVIIEKTAPTPPKYPRTAAKIKKSIKK
jgi:16S rRNA (guanine527-N7)-methyltransferase